MKNSIKTLFEANINDNKNFIKAYSESGNIASYYESDLENNPTSINFFLTDDEIAFCEDNSDDLCTHITDEVIEFIRGYDISIDSFLGYKVESVY